MAGFGRSEASKAVWTYRKDAQARQLQKLNYADDVTPEQRNSIEKELSVLPQAQREAAERQITAIHVTNDPDKSGYDPRTKEILMSPKWKAGDVIHEYGHALERELDLQHNAKYKTLRKKGLDLADLSKVMYDDTTYTEKIYYFENEKFVSVYQGRIYVHPEYGIFSKSGTSVNSNMMLEYFSEGYREYYTNPDNLKLHDPDLYEFIEGLSK